MFITELIFIFLLHEAALLPYERCTDFIVKENWDYREDDSGERSIQPTDADCCAQCSENEDCNAFTWVQDSSECWFHSTISDGRSSNLTIYTGYRREDAVENHRWSNRIVDSSADEIDDSMDRMGRVGYVSNTGRTPSIAYVCDPNAPCGCSRRPAITSRIVGGESALPSTWGWVVSLHFGTNNICSGSIIAASWVLTAAHCLEDISAKQITVYAGSNKRWNGTQILSVSKIVVHPSFDKATYTNDIALLHLSTPLNLTDANVGVICLPPASSATSSTDEWPPSATKTIAVGWGALYESGPLSTTLKQVTLETISYQSSACSSVISDPTVQFCTFTQSKDACGGDSGGPLMAFTSSRQWVLAGVISYGHGCARPNYAGVYTRVAVYRMWIESSIPDQLIHADSSNLTPTTTRRPEIIRNITSTFSSSLATGSSPFTRPDTETGDYYFKAIRVTASTSGNYTFVGDSIFDSYACLYHEPFNPNQPISNKIACADDNGSDDDFQLITTITAGQSMILVVTTFQPSETGSFNVQMNGPGQVSMKEMTFNVTSTYSNSLTTHSLSFIRPEKQQSGFHFMAIRVTAPNSGTYTFVGDSIFDSYACLYHEPFNPTQPMSNKIACDDDNGPDDDFQLTTTMRAGQSMILVVTTFHPSETGSFSVQVRGAAQVIMTEMTFNVTSTYSNSLTIHSLSFIRPEKQQSGFHFMAIRVTAPNSGTYTFVGDSIFDSYACLYHEPFTPTQPMSNKIACDDDNGPDDDFQLTTTMRAGQSMILVVTTFHPSETGSFSVQVHGLGRVTLTKQSCSSSDGGSFPIGRHSCWSVNGKWLVQCQEHGNIGDGWTKVRHCDKGCYLKGNGEVSCE